MKDDLDYSRFPDPPQEKDMATDVHSENAARVDGIGGVFLKANDATALADWYTKHFGLNFQSSDGDCAAGKNYWLEFVYHDDPDGTKRRSIVFAIQSAKSVLPAERYAIEINYRVADLDRFLGQLAAAGIPIEKREDYDYGRFAWIRDRENNRIELYQPL